MYSSYCTSSLYVMHCCPIRAIYQVEAILKDDLPYQLVCENIDCKSVCPMKSVCASVCLRVRVCVHDRCVSYCS